MKIKRTTKGLLSHIFSFQEAGILLFVAGLVVVIGLINPVFFNPENLLNILRSSSFIFVIGVGMTFVLISAGLDLSVASVFALGGIISSLSATSGLPIFLCVLSGILVGAALGLINGLLIVKFRIPALIVTLGMMYMGRGLVLIITKGAPIYPLPEPFTFIGQGSIFGIHYIVIVAVALAFLASIVLQYTRYGRSVYAIGGNEATAVLSGINVSFIKASVYVLTGVAAGLSGTMMAARLNSGQASAGTGYELLVIAAVIIGGTSLFGGAGTILGTAIGTLFMSVIANGMVLMRVSVYWQNLVVGAVIILAVGLDQYRRKRTGLI
jgi:ribose/xylose/arabinose/galactoside ABC-type transport system permease subunit